MRINLRQIEAFRAVFSTGSMTAAADLMGITQPAVSRLIRDVEAEIGLPLFERAGGRLVTTADAAVLYREVERSFHGLENIAAAAAALRGRREGDLRVAASFAPSFYALPAAISDFHGAWPGVKLTLRTRSSPDVIDLAALHQCDVGIAAVAAGAPGVETELLAALDIVCAMPAGHPLAAEALIGPHHLADVPFLDIAEHSPVRQRLAKVFEASGVAPRVVMESSYSVPICALVGHGAGIALLEPLTAHAHRHLGLELRPFEPAVPYEIRAVYPAGLPRGERTRAFVARVKERLNQPRPATEHP